MAATAVTTSSADRSAEHSIARDATVRLLDYCRSQDWAGYDPYDGLNSRWFQAFPILRNRWGRLAFIQGFKRSPINLRPLFAAPRGVNPKGIALATQSLLGLARLGHSSAAAARVMADRLVSLRTPGWTRACWGYHFDWQTRTYLVPRGYPNIICSSFAGEALLDAFEALGERRYLDIAADTGRFILNDLKRTAADDAFCFSYTPLCPSRVHNASLLGAALLARLAAATGEREFREAAEGAARYGIRHQRDDGSWIYGEDANQGWIDSFHTGYNLLALRALAKHLDLPEAAASVERGYRFYRQHFFPGKGVVKYFHDRTYPIDTHAVAHAILTLSEFADRDPTALEEAGRIIRWALEHMRSPEGWFYYQKWPLWTNRLNYMRWSQAWMLLALTQYLEATRG
ncbi:MAG: hypothetical protein M5U12_08795 [Verrucomicrobia bacterium]|nr:hypothetical protein [Verrucomicrobiota bacterium]